MGRRRSLKSVAEGTLGAFVGRGSDLNGYWAIGVLCLRTLERGEPLEIDVLAGRVQPPWESLAEPLATLLARCHTRLLEHVQSVGLWEEAVAEARVRLSFGPTSRNHAASVRYRCVVTLVDDRGVSFERSKEGWCWPHDPAREMRSARGGKT